jgi:hypothetical protein
MERVRGCNNNVNRIVGPRWPWSNRIVPEKDTDTAQTPNPRFPFRPTAAFRAAWVSPWWQRVIFPSTKAAKWFHSRSWRNISTT